MGLTKNFYVYIHRRGTDGKVFYVGKGHGNRVTDKSGRNNHWHNVTAKHGMSVEIVESGLQEWYALEREIELIAMFKESGEPLVNQTSGGEGFSGGEFTALHRERISDGVRAALHEGRMWTETHRANHKASVMAAAQTPAWKAATSAANRVTWADAIVRERRISGMTTAFRSPDVIAKRSASAQKRWSDTEARDKARASKIKQMRAVVCDQSGQVFQSVKEAMRWLRSSGFDSAAASNIRAACQKKLKTAYGFSWNYV